ncbi:hypothetical protein SFC42_21580 [Priestia filamentosa]|uniref:hypothetical protein n=1 Tax=Priestia filamentosa TaxID=1402861 RepID=UPI00398382AA
MSKDINVDIENKRNNKLSLDGFEVVPFFDDQHVIDETYALNSERDFNIKGGAELLFFRLFDLPYRLKDV